MLTAVVERIWFSIVAWSLNFSHILWEENKETEISEIFRLTIWYSSTCAPATLASRTTNSIPSHIVTHPPLFEKVRRFAQGRRWREIWNSSKAKRPSLSQSRTCVNATSWGSDCLYLGIGWQNSLRWYWTDVLMSWNSTMFAVQSWLMSLWDLGYSENAYHIAMLMKVWLNRSLNA